MAKSSFPFDAGPGSQVFESQWMRMARHWAPTGIIADALQECEVTATGTALQVVIRPGRAWIEGFFFESTADETLGIGTPHASLTRIDRVVLQLDRAGNTIDFAVLQGTPATNPTPPAVVQTETGFWQLPLAQIRVPPGVSAIQASYITDERIFSVPDPVPVGALIPYAGTTAPKGYLICDGRAVSRVQYARLFSVIGTTYGAGDGSTTFNLPDLRGRVMAGSDNLGGTTAGRLTGLTIGGSAGVASAPLSEAELAAHTHGVGSLGAQNGITAVGSAHSHGINITATTTASGPHAHSASVGGDTGFQIDPATRQVNVTGAVDNHAHAIDPPNTPTTVDKNTVTGADYPPTSFVSDHAHAVDPPLTWTDGVGDHGHGLDTQGGHQHAIHYDPISTNADGDHSHNTGLSNAAFLLRVETAGTYFSQGQAVTSHGWTYWSGSRGAHVHTVALPDNWTGLAGAHSHSVGAGGSHAHTIDMATFVSGGGGGHNHTHAHNHYVDISAFNSGAAGGHAHTMAHVHSLASGAVTVGQAGDHSHNVTVSGTSAAESAHTHGVTLVGSTASTGSNANVSRVQPTLGVNVIIRY